MQHFKYQDLIAESSGIPYERPLEFFFLRALLYSRLEVGFPSDRLPDEGANVYLAHLMAQNSLGQYGVKPVVTGLTMFRTLQEAETNSQKARIWRQGGDTDLLQRGIFSANGKSLSPRQLSCLEVEELPRLCGGCCYLAAVSHYERMTKIPGLIEVLEVLSSSFFRYVQVLRYLALEYLNFLPQMSDGECLRLQSRVAPSRAVAMDLFLAALHAWRMNLTPENSDHLLQTAREAGVAQDKLPVGLL